MRNWATFAVVIGLVLGSFPHAFCDCGCAKPPETQAGEHRAAAACPHCCPTPSEPTRSRPQPCKCGTCEIVKGVLAASELNVPYPESGWRLELTPAAWGAVPLTSPAPAKESRTDPPCISSRLGCALPILLERLLF